MGNRATATRGRQPLVMSLPCFPQGGGRFGGAWRRAIPRVLLHSTVPDDVTLGAWRTDDVH